jgi:hypothetical protein
MVRIIATCIFPERVTFFFNVSRDITHVGFLGGADLGWLRRRCRERQGHQSRRTEKGKRSFLQLHLRERELLQNQRA